MKHKFFVFRNYFLKTRKIIPKNFTGNIRLHHQLFYRRFSLFDRYDDVYRVVAIASHNNYRVKSTDNTRI